MPRFQYSTVDESGKRRKGRATAPSKEALEAKLQADGLSILSVDPIADEVADEPKTGDIDDIPRVTNKMPRTEVEPVPAPGLFEATVKRKDVAVFTRQLAATLNAGLPILRIIRVIHSRYKKPALKKILEQIGTDISKGTRFSDALARHPAVFDDTYCNMIRVGELGGNLPESVSRLATLIEGEMAIRRKVKAAMAYPMFILIFTATMTYGLMAFLMPMFSQMFLSSGLDIENDFPLTHFLIQASDFLRSGDRIMLTVVGLILAFVGYKYAMKVHSLRKTRDWLLLRSVVLGGSIKQLVAARFSRNFSILLQAGVPLIQALDLVSATAGNLVVADALRSAAKRIREGDGITDTLDKIDVFPDLLIQMAAMGEEAGSLPDMLERVADYYDDEVEATLTALTSILEPVMMVIIGAIVGVFVMGILLPILAVSTSVQNQI